ncbi:hypothetical protein SELMODRAFT_118883 [Selaginella moellendorffii]|uniref:EF-hand domain-containing protein n=1 Tax=Selaginella moellendorffii TaxID=88036 RepID=D8SKC6_SELML|nr:hypothetical protein SELMODRAFT_118883 [Selaginella moellendorffii]
MAAASEPVSLAEVQQASKDFRVHGLNPPSPAPSPAQSVKQQFPAPAVTLREVELALDETGEQREGRIRNLFALFDSSKSGFLDHGQIEQRLKTMSIPSHYKFAQDLLQVCDANHDGRVDFLEFRRYIDEKELELYHMFQQIDVTNDGYIHPEELRDALKNAGIHLSDRNLSKFMDHVDRDNNGIITFEEWRDFLLLSPHAGTITEVYQYWEKVCQIDIGEQAIIPEGISRHLYASRYFIAGGVAGAVSRTATAPLDRLKVILQVQTERRARPNLFQGLKQIYTEGGMAGFYVGNGINVLKVAPESAVKFYAFEMLKEVAAKIQGEQKSEIGPLGRLFAGGAAGAIAQTVVYPLDVVKTRLQVLSRKSQMSSLVRDMYAHEGFLSFYRGLVPSLVGIIPYAGIDLAMYETLKDLSRSILPEGTEPGPLTQLACGTISGAIGATSVYPLQLIRTRQAITTLSLLRNFLPLFDVFKRTLEHEGVTAFYKGLVPNLCKVAPAASITYVVYEKMKKLLAIQS